MRFCGDGEERDHNSCRQVGFPQMRLSRFFSKGERSPIDTFGVRFCRAGVCILMSGILVQEFVAVRQQWKKPKEVSCRLKTCSDCPFWLYYARAV